MRRVPGRKGAEYLAQHEQYAHLDALKRKVDTDPSLATVLGNAYDIAPDIVITRDAYSDAFINKGGTLVDAGVAAHSTLRAANSRPPHLQAVVSCKWTFRSDRAQNSRTESLSLVRNRKGRLPNIVVVTAEPLPSRLSSLALGTGDIDCLYHVALPELQAAVAASGDKKAMRLMDTMVDGHRLRDISDLPLDALL